MENSQTSAYQPKFLLMEEDIYAREIRGVRYIVHSVYSGAPFPQRFASLIKNSFDVSNTGMVTSESSLDNGIAIREEQ